MVALSYDRVIGRTVGSADYTMTRQCHKSFELREDILELGDGRLCVLRFVLYRLYMSVELGMAGGVKVCSRGLGLEARKVDAVLQCT